MQDIISTILSGKIDRSDTAVESAIYQQVVAVPWLDIV